MITSNASRDSLEQGDDGTSRRVADARQGECEQQREYHQREHVSVRRGGEHVGGITPLKKSATPGSGPAASARCRRARRAILRRLPEAAGSIRQQHHDDGAENRGDGADDDDPDHRTRRDPARPRRFSALCNAGHQQRDDQRDDGHFEAVEPQGADEGRNGQRASWAAAGHALASKPSSSPTTSAASAQYARKLLLLRCLSRFPLNAASGT